MSLPLFLSAQWRNLVMVNYEVDPSILIPFIPKGTELDLWNGKAFVSLVGFLFLDTKVRGFSIPFHTTFEEVNLRFYVKCNGERRGVGFIMEIVPRWAIAYIARRLYNENYIALPMRHHIVKNNSGIHAEYEWKFRGRWQKIGLHCEGEPQPILPGSEIEFITDHYWGYSVQQDKETMAYEVEHPRWRVWEGGQVELNIDFEALYGASFAHFLKNSPTSTFLAEGSEVKVFKGSRLH